MSSWVIQKATGISWLSNTHVLVPLKISKLIAWSSNVARCPHRPHLPQS